MKLWTEGSQIQVSILTKLANTVNNRNAGLIGINFNDKRQKDTYQDLREFISVYQKKINKALHNQTKYTLNDKSPNSIYNFKVRKIDKKKININEAGTVLEAAQDTINQIKKITEYNKNSVKNTENYVSEGSSISSVVNNLSNFEDNVVLTTNQKNVAQNDWKASLKVNTNNSQKVNKDKLKSENELLRGKKDFVPLFEPGTLSRLKAKETKDFTK